jgi:hypothetical protein
MAQVVLFSKAGLELTLSFEGGTQRVVLSFEDNGQKLVRELGVEDIVGLKEGVDRLLSYGPSVTEQDIADEESENDLDGMYDIIMKPITELSNKYFTYGMHLSSMRYTQESGRVEADVFIGLPQEDIDIFTIERIQNATGDFMEAMGFELKTQDEPVFGSFFQKLKFLWKGEVGQEAGEIYSKGKVALEAQFIDLPSAEATSKLATAAAGLITALDGVSDAAIRCGSILLVKVTKDGVPKIITETVSPELAALLNKNPALLQNPSIVFDLISGMRAPDRTIEESGSAEIAE